MSCTFGECIVWRTLRRTAIAQKRNVYAAKNILIGLYSAQRYFAKRLWDTGTLKPTKSGGRIQHDDPDLRNRILCYIQENHRLNTKIIAAEECVRKNTVWPVLKWENLHSYSFQNVQELQAVDVLKRKDSYKW